MRSVVSFLDHVPDRARAERSFAEVGPKVLEQGLVELDPAAAGEVHGPLDFAPEPSSLARGLFADDAIDAHLDALVAAQRADGGWTFNWPVWTPVGRAGVARRDHRGDAVAPARLRSPGRLTPRYCWRRAPRSSSWSVEGWRAPPAFRAGARRRCGAADQSGHRRLAVAAGTRPPRCIARHTPR
jgi:hypothetical protein